VNGTSSAINAAAYGLITWHFLTAAMILLTSTLAFLIQGRPEAVITAVVGSFLCFVGIQFGRRFARAVRGDDRFGF
jgi:hypothetical protein